MYAAITNGLAAVSTSRRMAAWWPIILTMELCFSRATGSGDASREERAKETRLLMAGDC